MTKDIEDIFSLKIQPMLCTLVKDLANDAQYLYEVKWDGYRILSYCKDEKVRLVSRGGLDYTKRYPLVAEALKQLKHDLILDGEIVVFNKDGIPDFDSLQLYNGHRTPIFYCVFDVLWLDGHNLMELPLIQRKEILRVLLHEKKILRYSDSFDNGKQLYEEMLEKGWEGIIAKRKDSPYVPGQRGSNWLKIPTLKRQEYVIGGWAESDKSRLFRSLLFGAYNDKGEFEWVGRSGGGYKAKEMPGIMKKLKALEINKSPFKNKILDTKGAVMHYVKPELVANFAFATWTKSGRIRKPATFLGFRNDKDPRAVVREYPQSITSASGAIKGIEEDNVSAENKVAQNGLKSSTKALYLNEDSNWKELDKIEKEDLKELPIGNSKVEVYNLGKVLWKDPEIKKADLLSYYASISEYILPYLKNRPLSVYIKHTSPTAPGLYIKDFEGRAPHYADVFSTERKHKKKGKRNVIEYFVVNNVASLLYLVNLGAIDLNPWSSRTVSPDHPDFIVIDLDPSDGDFKKAVETALAAKEVLDKYKLKAFPKTSGKTGIHLLIPCSGFTFSEARSIGSAICDEIHQLVSSITTREVSVNQRGDKLFIDDSQNDYSDTIASAYSVRPYKLPTVSTPIEWKEVNSKLAPEDFTIHTMKSRLEMKGNLLNWLFNKKKIVKNNQILKSL